RQEEDTVQSSYMPMISSMTQQVDYAYSNINETIPHSNNKIVLDQQPKTSSFNDQDQYPSCEEFDAIVQDYLLNLSIKKRDKALIDQERYDMILQVLKDPRNTAVSTAQFRFWVKKMFQLSPRQAVCHDRKPVAVREQIYGILVRAHRESHHGGRDKTSALVRKRFSWIPKELIARFVRQCPFCISRRNGSQHSSLSIFLPASPPTYSTEKEEDGIYHQAPPLLFSRSTASSNASCPEEIMLMMEAQQKEPLAADNAFHLSWQPTLQQQDIYSTHFFDPAFNNFVDCSVSCSSMLMDQKPMNALSMLYAFDENTNSLTTDATLSSFRCHNQEFDLTYPITNQYNTLSSPLLSPSSSSSSSYTSSPVHPVYHETNTIANPCIDTVYHYHSTYQNPSPYSFSPQ
ncbi:Nucleolar protein 4, partial [Choanephora cucurbitarum]